MSDSPPLIFRKVLGSLRPANRAADEALGAVDGHVTVKIGKVTKNQRRRAYYWVLLDVAAEVLQDKTGSPWDAESLHDFLKRKLRLGEPLLNTAREEVDFKVKSTADAKMTEVERARWLDRVANTLSVWCEVPMETLMQEVRERGAQLGEAA